MPKLPIDKGYTLVEALFTIAILAMVLVAMTPFIRTVHTSWNLGDRKTELQQNGRVGMEMISRLLRQAKRITAIPASGSGNFVKFRIGQVISNIFFEDAESVIFYHNIASSPYYIGDSGLIHVNDLVVRTIDITGAVNNALLARSLNNFSIDFKNATGQLVTDSKKPYDVYSVDISMSLSDPQGLIPDVITVFSSISLRPEVRINKPVWVASGNNIVEVSSDTWFSGFSGPQSVSVNSATGDCWVADTGNNRVRKIAPSGAITDFATGFSGPQSVSVNSATGDCWVADTGNNRVRKIAPGGAITDYATDCNSPQSVSVNSATGDCWVADTGLNRVRKIPPSGAIVNFATGFSSPQSVSVNPTTGYCWVADTGNNRVRRILPSGTIANYGNCTLPQSVSVNPTTGDCWVADTGRNRVRKITASGTTTNFPTGFSGPRSVSSAAAIGDCWIADSGNNQIVNLDSDADELFRISGFQSPESITASY